MPTCSNCISQGLLLSLIQLIPWCYIPLKCSTCRALFVIPHLLFRRNFVEVLTSIVTDALKETWAILDTIKPRCFGNTMLGSAAVDALVHGSTKNLKPLVDVFLMYIIQLTLFFSGRTTRLWQDLFSSVTETHHFAERCWLPSLL